MNESAVPAHSTNRYRRWLSTAAGVLFALVVVAVAVAAYAAHHVEPILRQSLVDSLEQRFHEPVQLDRLDISVARGLEVRGFGLRLYRGEGSTQPVVAVRELSFHVALNDLLRLHTHIDTAHLQGLELHIPPHAMHAVTEPGTPHPVFKVTVGKVFCKDAQLFLDTDQPGRQPLRFDIHNLLITDQGEAVPFLYEADLINPKPRGEVQAKGHFGPWNGQEPRATPIDGDYNFQNADLATFKGIRGTLNSTGHFYGQLGALTADGTTTTPDFGLDISGHSLPLETRFHAFVDGMTGDTTLAPVRAHLRNSWFTARGPIVRVQPTRPGERVRHDIALTVDMPNGRMEDLLYLAMKTTPPLLRGAVAMHARLHIPPGEQRIEQKLQLQGALRVTGVEFSNRKVQDRIDGWSMRAQGKPAEVKAVSQDRKAEVASQMDVTFTLDHAMVQAPSVDYTFPGMELKMTGAYSLDGNVFKFAGHVRTQAKASQMVKGWKSVLLKPLDPLFARDGAGVQLPVSVDGTGGDFSIGLKDAGESASQMAAQLRMKPHPPAKAAQ